MHTPPRDDRRDRPDAGTGLGRAPRDQRIRGRPEPDCGVLLLSSHMATIARVRTIWQNWPGAPGYTNMYCLTPSSTVPAIRTFFDAVKAILPTGMTLQVPGVGDLLDDNTGAITGQWSTTVPTVVTCTGAGNYAGNAGAVVSWLTGVVINGRRPQGRTFLVPIISGAMDSGGSLSGSTIATVQTAATALVTSAAGDLVIWHRPVAGGGGSNAPISGIRVPDLAASMRSRRT
jgi:hypothetical protein